MQKCREVCLGPWGTPRGRNLRVHVRRASCPFYFSMQLMRRYPNVLRSHELVILSVWGGTQSCWKQCPSSSRSSHSSSSPHLTVRCFVILILPLDTHIIGNLLIVFVVFKEDSSRRLFVSAKTAFFRCSTILLLECRRRRRLCYVILDRDVPLYIKSAIDALLNIYIYQQWKLQKLQYLCDPLFI